MSIPLRTDAALHIYVGQMVSDTSVVFKIFFFTDHFHQTRILIHRFRYQKFISKLKILDIFISLSKTVL